MDYRNFTLNSNKGDNTCNQSEASTLMVGNPFRNCARGPLFFHMSRFSLQFHTFAIVQFGKERIIKPKQNEFGECNQTTCPRL